MGVFGKLLLLFWMVVVEGMVVDEGGMFGSVGVDNMMWLEEVGLKRCSSC